MAGLGTFLGQTFAAHWEAQVVNEERSIDSRQAGLLITAWIAKGLVLRSDERGYGILSNILDLFTGQDDALAEHAARSLRIIADESDRVLSKENFAVIRFLNRQRFFSFLLPRLVSSYESVPVDKRSVYLVALSSVLQFMPKQLQVIELPKVTIPLALFK